MKNSLTNGTDYFAATDDPVVLADQMLEKIRIWREWCIGRGLIGLWKKKLQNYYGISINGNTSQAVTGGGTEGELKVIKVNDLRSLVQEQLVIVTSQRPAGQARAINSDTDSLKASKIASAVAEYYLSQQGFEGNFIQATEMALLCDEAFVELFWDKGAGDPIAVDPTTQIPEMSGDCILRTHAPWNVTRDPGLKVSDQSWNIISYRVNKFDMAASYPKFAEQILAVKKDASPEIPMNDIVEGSDAIFAHLLIHDRTPAIKNGRYSLLIGNNIVLDSALPYEDYPVERISPADVLDGPMGYASSNDILALEEVTDALHSIIVSNQVNFGGQCIVGPIGANINHTELAKGSRYIELPPDMVNLLRSLQLTQTAPEIFNYIGVLGGKKEKAVGSVASTLQQQAAQGASGSSMALIQTQAISYNSGIQRSFFNLMSGAMTKLIGILRTYADTPRVARIVGKSKAAGLKEFKYTGADLNSISSIVYEMVNPASQTFGGRLTLGQDLLKAGMISSPKQYINVVATGQIDVLTEDDESKQLLILEENEWLSEGKPFQALITQNHANHIMSHTATMTLEMQTNDPECVNRTLDHIQEHINIWMQASQTNPGILMATGQQPLMPPPPPMPPGGPPMPPPPPMPPAAAQMHGNMHGNVTHIGKMVGGGMPPAAVRALEVRKPNLPNIQGTKEKPTIPGVTDSGIV